MPTPLDLLRDKDLPRSILAICHNPDSDYLNFATTHNAKLWVRTAGQAQAAQPWPSAGPYDTIILPLPTNRETLSLCLAAACATLSPEGILYLFGYNDAGIKSSDRFLKLYFKHVELLDIGGHGRLYAARMPLRQDYKLSDFLQHKILPLQNKPITMVSYPGLFAKGKLDNATALLLENLPAISPDTRVLDFACGIGFIAKAIQLRQPSAQVTLVDHDALALLAAEQNVSQAVQCCIEKPQKITGTYDLIISNPPIHDGQTLDYTIVETLIGEMPRLLAANGTAYLVAQVTVPIARFAAQNKLAATEVAASKSFRITKITR